MRISKPYTMNGKYTRLRSVASSRPRFKSILGIKGLFFLLSILVICLGVIGTASATRFYLNQGGRLSSSPPSGEVKYTLSDRYVLEWQTPVNGDISGTNYGYSIFAETAAASGVSAYLEILLRSGGQETVLARWPRALWNTRNIERFSGSFSGPDPATKEGDTLVLRLGMKTPSKFHEYGFIWISRRYPSYISVPDFSTLTDGDLQNVRSELSGTQTQLDQLIQAQNDNQKRLEQLAASIERLERIVLELRENQMKEEGLEEVTPPPQQVQGPAPPRIYIRFNPSVLVLPPDKDQLFTCYLEMDEAHSISDVDLDSLVLSGPNGTLTPKKELHAFESPDRNLIADLQISFPAHEVAELFPSLFNKSLFSTLELSGRMKDGTSFRSKGVIRLKRRARKLDKSQNEG